MFPGPSINRKRIILREGEHERNAAGGLISHRNKLQFQQYQDGSKQKYYKQAIRVKEFAQTPDAGYMLV